ncbi:MAG: hypothetical protein ABIT83_25490 [Massilia sp.]
MDHLQAAGMTVTYRTADGTFEAEGLPGRDLFIVAQYLDPTEALLAQGCLVAGGLPAVVADANMVQAYSLIASAVGGVRVMVPQAHLQQAREMLDALKRGDFALDDNFDTGEVV